MVPSRAERCQAVFAENRLRSRINTGFRRFVPERAAPCRSVQNLPFLVRDEEAAGSNPASPTIEWSECRGSNEVRLRNAERHAKPAGGAHRREDGDVASIPPDSCRHRRPSELKVSLSRESTQSRQPDHFDGRNARGRTKFDCVTQSITPKPPEAHSTGTWPNPGYLAPLAARWLSTAGVRSSIIAQIAQHLVDLRSRFRDMPLPRQLLDLFEPRHDLARRFAAVGALANFRP